MTPKQEFQKFAGPLFDMTHCTKYGRNKLIHMVGQYEDLDYLIIVHNEFNISHFAMAYLSFVINFKEDRNGEHSWLYSDNH